MAHSCVFRETFAYFFAHLPLASLGAATEKQGTAGKRELIVYFGSGDENPPHNHKTPDAYLLFAQQGLGGSQVGRWSSRVFMLGENQSGPTAALHTAGNVFPIQNLLRFFCTGKNIRRSEGDISAKPLGLLKLKE